MKFTEDNIQGVVFRLFDRTSSKLYLIDFNNEFDINNSIIELNKVTTSVWSKPSCANELNQGRWIFSHYYIEKPQIINNYKIY